MKVCPLPLVSTYFPPLTRQIQHQRHVTLECNWTNQRHAKKFPLTLFCFPLRCFQERITTKHSPTPNKKVMDSSSSTSSTSSSSVPTPQMVNERSDRSDDEDVNWNLEETLDDWYFNKMQSTIKFYKIRVADFRRWLKDNYNRDIDRRLKKKHLRLYFTHKSQTVSQMRATIVCISSRCKQLKK